jgi:hypothetical protein
LCFPEARGPVVAVQAMAILAGILIMLYGGNSLTPALHAARAAGSEARPTYDRLRRRAVGLDAVALALGVGLLIAFATRPPLRTAGIVERSPAERARPHPRAASGSPRATDWREPPSAP